MQRGDCGVRRAMRGSGTTNVYPPHSIPRSSRLQLARILNLMSITISQVEVLYKILSMFRRDLVFWNIASGYGKEKENIFSIPCGVSRVERTEFCSD